MTIEYEVLRGYFKSMSRMAKQYDQVVDNRLSGLLSNEEYEDERDAFISGVLALTEDVESSMGDF